MTHFIQSPQETPDPRIDAAICDLIDRISQFSDETFNAEWIHLTEAEVIELVIYLIQYLNEQLRGDILSGLLLEIREKREKQ